MLFEKKQPLFLWLGDHITQTDTNKIENDSSANLSFAALKRLAKGLSKEIRIEFDASKKQHRTAQPE